jgi:hypothetical protein
MIHLVLQTGRVAQVVEHLPHKYKVLSSLPHPITAKRKKIQSTFDLVSLIVYTRIQYIIIIMHFAVTILF